MTSIPHAYAKIAEIRDGPHASFIDMDDGTCFRLSSERAQALLQNDRVLVDLSDWQEYGNAHVTVLRADVAVAFYGRTQIVQQFTLRRGEDGLTMGADAHYR